MTKEKEKWKSVFVLALFTWGLAGFAIFLEYLTPTTKDDLIYIPRIIFISVYLLTTLILWSVIILLFLKSEKFSDICQLPEDESNWDEKYCRECRIFGTCHGFERTEESE
jgi:hypothetical protein